MAYQIVVILGAVFVALFSSCQSNTYGTMVCGEIYMTGGAQITVEQDDRLRLPSKSSNLVVINNIYKEHNEKVKYHYADIDSIKVWHPASPDEIWNMIPVPTYGWCMRYVENPYIQVLAYSSQGYGVLASGRMTNFYTQRIISKSKVRFLIAKPGMPIIDIGGVSGYGNASWRERLCSFVADDQELCAFIRQSHKRKFEILRLLTKYKPNQQIKNYEGQDFNGNVPVDDGHERTNDNAR